MAKREKKVTMKRYQFWGPKGIEWTKWFPYNGESKEKWQLKPQGLRNEYK